MLRARRQGVEAFAGESRELSRDHGVKQMVLPQEVQQEMLSRLRRIEGQARGVQRMVEEGRDCAEIIQQLAAIRAATQSASLFLLKHYAKECSAAAAKNEGSAKPIEDLVDLMLTIS